MDQFILDKQRFIESNGSNGKYQEKYLLNPKKIPSKHALLHYLLTYCPPPRWETKTHCLVHSKIWSFLIHPLGFSFFGVTTEHSVGMRNTSQDAKRWCFVRNPAETHQLRERSFFPIINDMFYDHPSQVVTSRRISFKPSCQYGDKKWSLAKNWMQGFPTKHIMKKNNIQVLPSDLFGCFKWPFQGLSDLHLGDQKVTWKKLDMDVEPKIGVVFTPQNGWLLVYFMENPMNKWMKIGGFFTPYFWFNTHILVVTTRL